MTIELKPNYLDIVQACRCTHVRRISRVITNIYDEALKGIGLKSTQFTLLVAIALSKASKLTDVANLLFMDLTTLTRSVQRLEKNNLVKLEFDESDRRNRLVSVTEIGQKKLIEAIPLWKQAQEEVAKVFGKDMIETFMDNLNQLAENYQNKSLNLS